MILRIIWGTLVLGLLASPPSSAQTAFQRLMPGHSTLEDAVRLLGPPIRTGNPESFEFIPDAGVGKMQISVRKGSTLIDRIELHFSTPIVRSALADRLSLPGTPEIRRTNTSGKLEEYYGGSALLGLTYAGADEGSGVSGLSYYSRELFGNVIAAVPSIPGTGAAPPPAAATQPFAPSPVDNRKSWSVPAGTLLQVQMESSLTSKRANVGDAVSARVTQNVSLDNQIVVPAGSVVEGRVSQAKKAKRMGKPGMIAVEFNSIVFPNGSRLNLSGVLTAANAGNDTVISEEGRVQSGSGNRAAVFIGGGTAAGAIIGGVTGGGQGAGIGAATGAASGMAFTFLDKGPEAEIPAGMPFGIQLTQPLVVTVAAIH